MKQITLFSSWTKPAKSKDSASTSQQSQEIIAIDSDNDDNFLIEAMEESMKTLGDSNVDQNTAAQCQPSTSKNLHSNPPRPTHLIPYKPTCNDSEHLDGFSMEAGQHWIYSNNFPLRDYQYKIAEQALFRNTLVCLPTGLGKTFIAAVVMYNFYRWYPDKKIVFMAPTRPLVAQQITACYKVTGIPEDSTIEMTGSLSPSLRKKLWEDKRVFFLTPQVIVNDLHSGTCLASSICCLVLDEAHKATGNYAYCQVIREVTEKGNRQFRVLALTATPGSDILTVQEIINNLLISHIELRTDECPDILQYSHAREIEKIIIPLSSELNGVKEKLANMLQNIISRLKTRKAIWPRFNVSNLSKFMMIKQREEFLQSYGKALSHTELNFIQRDYTCAISLFHGYDLLSQHGLRPLYTFFRGILNGEKGSFVSKIELSKLQEFRDLWDLLEQRFATVSGDNKLNPMSSQAPFLAGHPKVDKIKEILIDHFNKFTDANGVANTKVIIFTNFRDSVDEIMHMLKQMRPLIRPINFVGQSSANKSSKGYTQKEQLRVMKEFREGGYNTLVSTCVGEEGLDIGEVDLIICFDSHKSPVRMIQRMGRTGRKRQGKIVVLLTEGKENQNYNTSLTKKNHIYKAIFDGFRRLNFYPNNPRMIPLSVHPQPDVKPIEILKRKEQLRKNHRSSIGEGQHTISGMIHSGKYLKNNKNLQLSDSTMSHAKTYQTDTLNFEPIGRNYFVTLDTTEPNLELSDTITSKFNLNSCLPKLSLGLQEVDNIDHSQLTHNVISVLRILEEHKRGRTSVIFHAMGLRSVDLEEILSQELEPVKEKKRKKIAKEIDSDEDFDLSKLEKRSNNERPTMLLDENLTECDMTDSNEFTHIECVSPIFGMTQSSQSHFASDWLYLHNFQPFIVGGLRTIPSPPDIVVSSTVDLTNISGMLKQFWTQTRDDIYMNEIDDNFLNSSFDISATHCTSLPSQQVVTFRNNSLRDVIQDDDLFQCDLKTDMDVATDNDSLIKSPKYPAGNSNIQNKSKASFDIDTTGIILPTQGIHSQNDPRNEIAEKDDFFQCDSEVFDNDLSFKLPLSPVVQRKPNSTCTELPRNDSQKNIVHYDDFFQCDLKTDLEVPFKMPFQLPFSPVVNPNVQSKPNSISTKFSQYLSSTPNKCQASTIQDATQLTLSQACNFLDESTLKIDVNWSATENPTELGSSLFDKMSHLYQSKPNIITELDHFSLSSDLFDMTVHLSPNFCGTDKINQSSRGVDNVTNVTHNKGQETPFKNTSPSIVFGAPISFSDSFDEVHDIVLDRDELSKSSYFESQKRKASTSSPENTSRLSIKRHKVFASPPNTTPLNSKCNIHSNLFSDSFDEMNDMVLDRDELSKSSYFESQKRRVSTSPPTNTSRLSIKCPKVFASPPSTTPFNSKYNNTPFSFADSFDEMNDMVLDRDELSKSSYFKSQKRKTSTSPQAGASRSSIKRSKVFESPPSMTPFDTEYNNEDDDFIQPLNVKKDKLKKPPAATKKKKEIVREFFVSQAQVSSGEETDGDHNDSDVDLDAYEASFVDDNDHIVDKSIMQGVYLQSLKSPPFRKRNALFQKPKHTPGFIYSQFTQPHGDDDYEHDSFCVRSSQEESPVRPKKKSKREKPKKSSKINPSKGRMRLICQDDSSGSDDFI